MNGHVRKARLPMKTFIYALKKNDSWKIKETCLIVLIIKLQIIEKYLDK